MNHRRGARCVMLMGERSPCAGARPRVAVLAAVCVVRRQRAATAAQPREAAAAEEPWPAAAAEPGQNAAKPWEEDYRVMANTPASSPPTPRRRLVFAGSCIFCSTRSAKAALVHGSGHLSESRSKQTGSPAQAWARGPASRVASQLCRDSRWQEIAAAVVARLARRADGRAAGSVARCRGPFLSSRRVLHHRSQEPGRPHHSR